LSTTRARTERESARGLWLHRKPRHGVARTVSDEVFCRRRRDALSRRVHDDPDQRGRHADGGLVVFRDITERRRIESELVRLNTALAEQARRDPLTGLGNRLALEEDLVTYDARRGPLTATPTACCCATSITSRRSTTAKGTRRGTTCCARSPTPSGARAAPATPYTATAARTFLVLLAEQTLKGR
jgi:hypothetical protein